MTVVVDSGSIGSRFKLSLLRSLNVDFEQSEREQLTRSCPNLASTLNAFTAAISPPPADSKSNELKALASTGRAGWAHDQVIESEQKRALNRDDSSVWLYSPNDILGEARVTASGNSSDLKCVADGNPSTYWAATKSAYTFGASNTGSSWIQCEFPVPAAIKAVLMFVDGPDGDIDLLPPQISITVPKAAPTSEAKVMAPTSPDLWKEIGSLPVPRSVVMYGRSGWLTINTATSTGKPVPARFLRVVFDGKNQSRVRGLKVLTVDAPQKLAAYDSKLLLRDAALAVAVAVAAATK